MHRRHQDVCKQRGYEDWAQKAGETRLVKGPVVKLTSPADWGNRIDCCPNEVCALAEDRWSKAEPLEADMVSNADSLTIQGMLGKGLTYPKELVKSTCDPSAVERPYASLPSIDAVAM